MIDPKYIKNLKGKSYPMWGGVLDAAIKDGLRRLTTEIVQIPAPENGHLAVVRATAEFEDGRVFTDVGDCGPGNTTPEIAKSSLRMASTRAKGRALRDALNVSETMFEELPPDDTDATPRSAPSAVSTAPAPAARPAPARANGALVGGILAGGQGGRAPAAGAAGAQRAPTEAWGEEVKQDPADQAMVCCRKSCLCELSGYEYERSMKRFRKALCPTHFRQWEEFELAQAAAARK